MKIKSIFDFHKPVHCIKNIYKTYAYHKDLHLLLEKSGNIIKVYWNKCRNVTMNSIQCEQLCKHVSICNKWISRSMRYENSQRTHFENLLKYIFSSLVVCLYALTSFIQKSQTHQTLQQGTSFHMKMYVSSAHNITFYVTQVSYLHTFRPL